MLFYNLSMNLCNSANCEIYFFILPRKCKKKKFSESIFFIGKTTLYFFVMLKKTFSYCKLHSSLSHHNLFNTFGTHEKFKLSNSLHYSIQISAALKSATPMRQVNFAKHLVHLSLQHFNSCTVDKHRHSVAVDCPRGKSICKEWTIYLCKRWCSTSTTPIRTPGKLLSQQ